MLVAQSSTFNSEIKEKKTKLINADTDYPAPVANSHFTSFHSTSLFLHCFRILAQVNAIEVSPLQKVEMVTIMKAISYNFEVG